MSHFSRIDLKITDLNCLKKAVKRLGGEFRENQTSYKWWGRYMGDSPLPEGLTVNDLGKCDHAISFPGKAQYEIGVVKSKTKPKNYELLYDYWQSGGLNQVVGQNAGLLKQAYGIEAAKTQALLSGYTTTERKEKDGSVKLVISVS